jgi:hypothetical protein
MTVGRDGLAWSRRERINAMSDEVGGSAVGPKCCRNHLVNAPKNSIKVLERNSESTP